MKWDLPSGCMGRIMLLWGSHGVTNLSSRFSEKPQQRPTATCSHYKGTCVQPNNHYG